MSVLLGADVGGGGGDGIEGFLDDRGQGQLEVVDFGSLDEVLMRHLLWLGADLFGSDVVAFEGPASPPE
jgi:hypothetical protein